MKYIYKILLLMLTITFITGCTAGKDFSMPKEKTYKVGSTTYSEIIDLYGNSQFVSTVGNKITIAYAYADYHGQGVDENVIPSKSIGFTFFDKILAAVNFSSSFMKDNTDFDEKLVSKIEKNVSNYNDILKIYGIPKSKSIFPATEDKNIKEIVYNITKTYKRGKNPFSTKTDSYSKSLKFKLNEKDIVIDIEVSSSSTEI